MLTEDFCSFEVAKLLKEKGFDELCIFKYNSEGVRMKAGVFIYEWQNSELNDDECSCPSQSMAMKWLREVHNLQIQITPIISRHKDWTFGIDRDFSPLTIDLLCFPTYEEAVEAALKHCLKNLI